MADTDKVFAGSIPETYDTLLVPLIFEVYAADLARRVAEERPARVLETCAGSGVVARALAPLLDAAARYTVTDLNPPMLERAMARQPPDARIDWRAADATDLPFADGAFDVVCCQFGAMFFPDRTAGYREARRVLRPGGLFAFNVWDRIETNDFARIVTEVAAGVFPDDPPRFLARTPHGYHDVDQIQRDVEAAGFSAVEIETRRETSTAATAREAAIAYCHGTPLNAEILARDPEALETVTDLTAAAIAAAHGDAPAVGAIQGHVIVARA